MPICVLVLKKRQSANDLKDQLREAKTPITTFDLIAPASYDFQQKKTEEIESGEKEEPISLTPVTIETVELLNPKLARKRRQSTMAKWLMPFGFIAGLSFTKMTGLTTFADLGISQKLEPMISSLLGMGSGWIGSQYAASSINTDKSDDIQTLRKRNQEGLWLLILETPIEIELPWHILKASNPIEVLTLRDF